MLSDTIKKYRLYGERQWILLLSRWRRLRSLLPTRNIHRSTHRNMFSFGILILIIIGVFFVYTALFIPPSNFPTKQYITIESGEGLTTIANTLVKTHVVKNAKILIYTVRLLGGQRTVAAGDYSFAIPLGTFAVARRITTGTYGLTPVSVTIPEGTTVREMAPIYAKKLFKFKPSEFIKEALPYEGFLYPDTYHFLPNASAKEVIESMRDNFKNKIVPLSKQIQASSFTLKQIVTLASIIQKEAWKKTDQRRISGVLQNRLKKGMLLQVDATFTYTHNKGTSQITVAELQDKKNPYNTYVHKGLPPGPIASVNISTIKAVLDPIKSDDLFYLADRYGNTHYSRTYAEHLQKMRRYLN